MILNTSNSTQEELESYQNNSSFQGTRYLMISFMLLSSFVWGCGDPPPPCGPDHELKGEIPPTDADELAKVANKRFHGTCVVQGSRGWLRDGLDREWHKGGKVLKSSYLYEGGIRHGEYQIYYADGTLREKGEYRFGLKHGRYAQYHRHGDPHIEGMYEDGRKSGDFSIYSDNGMHVQKGPYFLDKKHGKWTSTFNSLNGNDTLQIFYYHEGQRVISQR